MEHQSRPTSVLFDSRKVPRAKGIGYPSCNTELMPMPPNTKDPHGYYKEIGVDPGADRATILARVRALFRMHHPDTGDGDTERFNRVRLIAEVLLDDVAREKYNRTPPGMRLMDAVYESELSKMDEFNTMTEEELEGTFKVVAPEKPKNPYATSLGYRYDYFAKDHDSDPWRADGLKSQLWYHFLIESAPAVNYRRIIKVMMVSGEPAYHHDVGIMEIPRSWEPSIGAAYSLWTVVAGFRPGKTDPQHRLSTIYSQMSV